MTEPDYLISTPENVDLHLELAGAAARIWAAFLDILIMAVAIFSISLVLIVAGGFISSLPIAQAAKSGIVAWLSFIYIFLLAITTTGYFIYFEGKWQGQTPGKRVMHIRVIEANGQPIGWSAAFIRNLLRIVDNIALIGVLFLIFDRHERRIGDLAAGTLVIRERQTSLADTSLKLRSLTPPLSFIDPGQLSTKDFNLLSNFLKRREAMTFDSRAVLAKEMRDYFCQKLNPEIQGESAEELLEKIYLAYTRHIENQS
jgi:uncharacterized RDD family membrane protein YckC